MKKNKKISDTLLEIELKTKCDEYYTERWKIEWQKLPYTLNDMAAGTGIKMLL